MPLTNKPVAWWDGDPKNTLGISKTKELPDWKPLYAAPVRTKDLTDEELNAMWYGNTKDGWLGLFRAVIAADREKNK